MGMLTFREEWKDKLLSQEKRQTIRARRMPGDHLFIWCPTPRTGRGLYLGKSEAGHWDQTATRGRDFTEEIAGADGFGTAQELKQWLMDAHGMTRGAVDAKVWYVIRWEWTEGPNGH